MTFVPAPQSCRGGAAFRVCAAVAIYVAAAAGLTAAAAADSCRHVTISSLPSPDGAWRAEIDEAVCEGGAFASAIVDSVLLFDVHNPGHGTDVLGLQTGGRPADRPRLLWAEPDRLEVTVPNLSFLKVSARHVGSVSVDIRFDPPDAAARAAWLRKLGLPPDD
jgi:hypothetical protein